MMFHGFGDYLTLHFLLCCGKIYSLAGFSHQWVFFYPITTDKVEKVKAIMMAPKTDMASPPFGGKP